MLRNPAPSKGLVETTPYSYSWDYPKMARELAPRWSVTQAACPLGPTNLGAHYWLYVLMPDRELGP